MRSTDSSDRHEGVPSTEPDASVVDDAASAGARSRRRGLFWSLRAPLLLGLLSLLIYNANLRVIGAGDTLPARYLPLGIWRHHTLKLNRIAHWVAHGHRSLAEWARLPGSDGSVPWFEPYAYWMIRGREQNLVSYYPVVAPLLVSPLYLPAVIYLDHRHWQQPDVDRVAEAMEKISASVLAALATVLMYLLLRRDAGRWTLVLTVAFAFGTNTWMTSSQALWQHGAAEVFILTALLLAVSRPTTLKQIGLGVVCALIAANRPPDSLLAGAIAVYTLQKRHRAALWLTAGAAIPLAALLFFNFHVIGSMVGGYGKGTKPVMYYFQHSAWEGIAGLLVSPARGLLTFSPFFVFVPLGFWQRLLAPQTRRLAIALGLAVILQLLLYSQMDWRAGTSWGPRYLTDALPLLVWMLAPALSLLPPTRRAMFFVMVIASVAVQAIGAFWYTKTSEEKLFSGPNDSLRNAWDIGNVPFLSELRHAPAGGELQCSTGASIDLIGSTLRPDPAGAPATLAPGAILEGWALACGRSPAQLFLLIDGAMIATTEQFLPRPDVDAAMHTRAPSGWHVEADLRGVQPGERLLQVALRVQPRSDIRIVRELRVMVATEGAHPASTSAPPFSVMADRAAILLKERLSAEGYWVTSYTAGMRFEAPHVEMNTFLTATMIDFLSPISRECHLTDELERARRHLAAQIEGNGLVRYHGLPDAPTIGTLGCAITPDSDDTALAWRIAGNPGDVRRTQVLDKLNEYRDARGLYRTWLAPRDQYQCLDPGRDPNPTDATIQMHIYLMLHALHLPAADDLCSALQRVIVDDDVWVYYAKAPLMPFLRATELRATGCSITLSADRLTHSAPGQEPWMELGRAIAAASSAQASVDRRRITDLLAQLARNDFAELRHNPPLLFHNDLTASVPRFYWSEDFGYVLWLRAYHAIQPGFSTTAGQ